MDNKLTNLELQSLYKYRVREALDHSFLAADILDDSKLDDLMNNLAAAIDAPTLKTAASILIKRYAFLPVISLYAMTVWDKKLNISFKNVQMELPAVGEGWLPSFVLMDLSAHKRGEDRSEWRKAVIKEIFAENTSPLLIALEKRFGISKWILWENIAIYVYWLYESELKDLPNAADDFQYLLFEAEEGLFGRMKENPLQKYFGKKTYMEEWGIEVRTRRTCCFTYQLPAGKHCKTCPRTHLDKDGRCHDG